MGSCFSTNKTFQGEGRTLNEPARPAAVSASNPTSAPGGGGGRLGGASATSAAPSSGAATSDAEREARAKAAERRMNQQAAKGTPGQGKLSKQLQTQKQANPHSLADQDDQPERVVPYRSCLRLSTATVLPPAESKSSTCAETLVEEMAVATMAPHSTGLRRPQLKPTTPVARRLR
ncbi:hypothetical protein PaG_04512 [Moesziomyces aphidis]|uniref:Uncharacterized protein n=1 Tax=Moesziomyces aphidis TaxID=84754 RepID=W3VIV7_MOEAP|nr:hypothetical protein PaG_04512 [Moesziomyces aphidis]